MAWYRFSTEIVLWEEKKVRTIFINCCVELECSNTIRRKFEWVESKIK